jgi:hypothetical protein
MTGRTDVCNLQSGRLQRLDAAKSGRANPSAISDTRDPIDQNLRLLSRYPSDPFVCAGEELINITAAGIA